jgi:hypothetical protein
MNPGPFGPGASMSSSPARASQLGLLVWLTNGPRPARLSGPARRSTGAKFGQLRPRSEVTVSFRGP